MKILFVTAHPHTPQIAGGSQSSTHELSLFLIARGHEVSVVSGIYHKDLLGWRVRLVMKLTGRRFVRDQKPGYPTYRKWHVWEDAEAVAATVRPDVVVVTAGQPIRVAKAFVSTGLPLVVYLRDVEFHKQGGVPAELPEDTVYVANSRFTAGRYREAFGIDPVPIPPMFMAERYRTARTPRTVTFINPHGLKGRDIAFDIAEACPDIPFSFVEGWPLDDEQRRINAERARKAPNVAFEPRRRDMREIYSTTKILLAPSRWQEAWGRIASEAHYSGIPVVATAHGGLVESVGPGGVLIPPDAPSADWIAAVRRLWDDEAHYARLSQAALDYATRPELDPERQVDVFVSALDRARDTGRASAAA